MLTFFRVKINRLKLCKALKDRQNIGINGYAISCEDSDHLSDNEYNVSKLEKRKTYSYPLYNIDTK